MQEFCSVTENIFVFLIQLRPVVSDLEVAGPTEVVNHLWKGRQKILDVHSCITFALSEFRWGSFCYNGLLQ